MGSIDDRVKWSSALSKTIAPLDFYHEHYANVTRGDLKHIDYALYQRLLRDGMLSSVPTDRKPRRELDIIGKDHELIGKDPLGYYNKHYQGLNRGQLRKQDRSLYQLLWRRGLLNQIPPSGKERKKRP